MKKLFSIFFVLSFLFLGLSIFSTSSIADCQRVGDALDIDAGTLDDSNFKTIGDGSYAADNCTEEPRFYKLIGHKIMLCLSDPYNANGVTPDFEGNGKDTGCTVTLIESVAGAPIVIKPGIETNLLGGGVEDLLIPIGAYPYAVLIASNHLYIKHFESYVRNGTAYTMAGYGPSGPNDYSIGTICYTTDRGNDIPTSSTYSNTPTQAAGSNGVSTIDTVKVTSQGVGFTENVISPDPADARTLGLACADSIPTSGPERYGYTSEIIDSLNDRDNGSTICDDANNCETTFGNYENYEADFAGVDGSVAFNLLKNDLTIALNRNEARKIAYFVAFDKPIKISEETISFKIAVSTSESVSVDHHYVVDRASGRIQGKKMGANPFGVKFQTKTKRVRGAWR